MTKAEWGTKRNCLSCGARFYDMRKNPITCPKCDTEFSADDFVTRRRPTRPTPVEAKPVEEVKKPEKVDDDDIVDDDDDADDGELSEVEDDSDDDVIEDTSDLGEDDDDMAEVLEHTEAEDKE